MGIRHFYVFPHVALSTSYKSQCCQRPTSQMRTLRLKEAKEIIAREWLSQESHPQEHKAMSMVPLPKTSPPWVPF